MPFARMEIGNARIFISGDNTILSTINVKRLHIVPEIKELVFVFIPIIPMNSNMDDGRRPMCEHS